MPILPTDILTASAIAKSLEGNLGLYHGDRTYLQPDLNISSLSIIISEMFNTPIGPELEPFWYLNLDNYIEKAILECLIKIRISKCSSKEQLQNLLNKCYLFSDLSHFIKSRLEELSNAEDFILGITDNA